LPLAGFISKNSSMKKTLFLLLSGLFFQRCSNSDQALQTPTPIDKNAPQILRGSFETGLNGQSIHDCNTGKSYTVTPHPILDSLYRQTTASVNYSGKSVYAVLRGRMAGDTLTITDVDALEAKTPWNTCIPFEFWCSGTEPFWDLEISQAEAGLFYQDVGQQNGTKYAWATPKIEGDTWTYEAPATADDQPAIRVVIKKEKANNGMSDVTYNYSSELTIGNEKRKGVAIRWGEPKMEPK